MKNEIFAIWLCKPGTYMMPMLYEACIATWVVQNPNMKIVLYTDNPELKFNILSKDVTEVRLIQDEFPDLLETANKIITDDVPSGMRFAHRSDYIRYFILSVYGGIYVDCDLICLTPIESMVQQLQKDGIGIVMAYEDTMRICNAFMGCITEPAQKFYCDIVDNYNDRYVKSSYTFNSIKYPMLLKNRYQNITTILPFKKGFFFPNWEKNENGNLGLLTESEIPDKITGYGIHLYNTDPKWKKLRTLLENNLYSNDLDYWLLKHLNTCIDLYIDKMVETDTRDITKDQVLVKNLTDLYGQEYVENFKKEK